MKRADGAGREYGLVQEARLRGPPGAQGEAVGRVDRADVDALPHRDPGGARVALEMGDELVAA